ncbi:unnamed protein product [Moneuplotes crassus]|uniref:RING-type domain-containing protein n=1 Tax=Euplotes crassus TaxID=5936 RepID=A0AAD1Y545_EUPCR|nr:unnamed protein product [Moneuplotes crassus]
MEAITMSRKINQSNTDSKEDFRLPPANKYSGSRKQVKVKRQSTKGDSTRLGSKNSDRMGGMVRGDTIGSMKTTQDHENIPSNAFEKVPNKLSSSNLNDEIDTSGLTEKQELALLKNKIMDQRKELENRNDILTALQRNFEALSMFCKKERAEAQSIKNMNEKLKEEIRKYIEKITGMDNKIKTISADNELLAKDRIRAKKLADELHDLKIQKKVVEKNLENSRGQCKRIGDANERTKSELQKLKQDYKIECEKTKSLQQKIRDEDARIANINKQHQEEMMKLRDEHKRMMDVLKDNMSKLKGNSAKEHGDLMSELQETRNKVKELEKIADNAQKDAHTKDVLLKAEKTKVDSLNTQVADLLRNIKNGSSNFDSERKELLEKIHELTKSKDVLKAQYSELNSRLTDLSQKNLSKEDQANRHMEELSRTINNLQLKIDEAESEKQELIDRIQQLDQKMFSTKCDHDNEIKELKRLHSDALSLREKKIEELQMEVRMMGQKLSSSDKATNSSEKEIRDKENEITKLKQEIESLTERIRVMLAEMDKKQAEVEKMEKDKADREKIFESKLSHHLKKIQDYEARISGYEGTINELNEKITSLVNSHAQEGSKGKDAVKQLEYEIAMLKKSHKEEIDKLKGTIEKEVRAKMGVEKKHKEEIYAYEQKILSLNKEIRTKIGDIDHHKGEIEKLKEEIQSCRGYADLLKIDITNQKEAISQLNEENKELQTHSDFQQDEIAKLKAKLGNIPDFDLEEIALKEKIAKMKESKIKALIDKIDHVMASMESNMCCYLCMEIFNEGQTITPCGHNFCQKCLDEHKPDKCPKCDKKITSKIPDVVINDVVAKYLFQRDILSSFKNEDVWKNMAEDKP